MSALFIPGWSSVSPCTSETLNNRTSLLPEIALEYAQGQKLNLRLLLLWNSTPPSTQLKDLAVHFAGAIAKMGESRYGEPCGRVLTVGNGHGPG